MGNFTLFQIGYLPEFLYLDIFRQYLEIRLREESFDSAVVLDDARAIADAVANGRFKIMSSPTFARLFAIFDSEAGHGSPGSL